MAVYLILRRGGWRTPVELHEALERAGAESRWISVGWLRSYVLAEFDGTLGTICVYDAASPEAVRMHAYRAGLPVDEIVAVAETVVVRDEGAAIGAGRRSSWDTRGEERSP